MIDGVEAIRSPRAKRIALRLDTKSGRIRLVIPMRGSERKAWDFALQNRAWIESRLATLPQKVGFADGAIIPFEGRDRIVVTEQGTSNVSTVSVSETEIRVITKRDEIGGILKRWLIKQAQDRIAVKVAEKAALIGKTVSSISIRDQKTRWGSCSADGTLCFSWRLVLAPPAVLDYVVAHEVAHLVHLNHSPAFWDLCRSLSAEYTFGKHWLNMNGTQLGRYGG